MRYRRALILAALMPLAACSGGGGSSGGGSVAGGGTAVTPTPTPTTTPTPTNARFTVEAPNAVVGTFQLRVGENGYDFNLPSAQFFTDINGSNLPDTTRSAYGYTSHWTTGFPATNFSADYAIQAWGVENPTRIARGMVAPRKATTVSPLTSLIHDVGDQVAVKRALGLGPALTFKLPAGIDLTTYSATQDLALATPQSEPGQVLAANIRVNALIQGILVFQKAPGSPIEYGVEFGKLPDAQKLLGAYIKANPAATLDNANGIRDLLRSLPKAAAGLYRDDVYQRAGAAIHAFALAARAINENPSYAPRFSLCLQAVLRARLNDLAEANDPSVTPVGAIDSLYYLDAAVAKLADTLPFTTNQLVPLSDFYRLTAGGTTTIYKDAKPGFAMSDRPNMVGNDVTWTGGSMVFMLDSPASTIRSISVPASSGSAIDAVLQPSGDVVVTAKPGFTGIATYDYTVEIQGLTNTGRVYLLVR